uniref:Helix-hairpin-helix DNA-binding motif class 1 domain-containing protein n=1 Tax=viral metagenome TaxID=1070528 RepID=A0A6H1ZPI0_9ZZZZ
MLLIDLWEPPAIFEALELKDIPVRKQNLVEMGMGDYLWKADHTITVERKTITDFLNSRERLEVQLVKNLENADEVVLLLEGVYTPSLDGYTEVWKRRGKYYYLSTVSRQAYRAIQASLSRFQKLGVDVAYTCSIEGTVETLGALYKNSLKGEHKTFKRYIRTKPTLFTFDPDVEFLVALPHAGIGEVTAKALKETIGDRWKVINSSVEELCVTPGVGRKTAQKILEAVGRCVD